MVDYFTNMFVFIVTAFQSGYFSIPQMAIRNYIESWAMVKAKS